LASSVDAFFKQLLWLCNFRKMFMFYSVKESFREQAVTAVKTMEHKFPTIKFG